MNRVICGDALATLKTLSDAAYHCCVTSPPYWGLRNYGIEGQIGLEETPEEYVGKMVEVFREVRRLLRDDGTLWLNLGDSYTNGGGRSQPHRDSGGAGIGKKGTRGTQPYSSAGGGFERPCSVRDGLKPKELVGIPWRVAFALQSDGWYLRQDIIWHKPNPMPESVKDRCTKSHEYLFLLAKSSTYWFDDAAIKEDAETKGYEKRNKRSVWTIALKPHKGAHFATFPPALVETCILAGCPIGGTVIDPFAGAGTTLAVAKSLGRESLGIELNPEYAKLAENR